MNKWFCLEYIFMKIGVYSVFKMKILFWKSGRYKLLSDPWVERFRWTLVQFQTQNKDLWIFFFKTFLKEMNLKGKKDVMCTISRSSNKKVISYNIHTCYICWYVSCYNFMLVSKLMIFLELNARIAWYLRCFVA